MKTILDGRTKRGIFVVVLSFGLMCVAPSYAQNTIGEGNRVSLEYTLTLEDKTVFETIVYTHGAEQIPPGLEKQLTGLKAGDTKKIELLPEEGYGPVDPQRIRELPKEQIPESSREVGKILQGHSSDGQTLVAWVKEVKDKTIIVDTNHPLAGKKLLFDVKILKVETGAPQKTQLPDATPGTKSKK